MYYLPEDQKYAIAKKYGVTKTVIANIDSALNVLGYFDLLKLINDIDHALELKEEEDAS